MPQTITEALIRDHNAVMREVAMLRNDPRLAARMYPSIADAIRRHSAAEEATFYPTLRSVSPLDARVVGSLEAGHKQIAASLAMLDRTPYGSPQFTAGFWRMATLLAAHIRYEEMAVFPHAARVLPLARQYALARRYNARMGAGRSKNASILIPAMSPVRKRNCACKNPCGCKIGNAKRSKWYHHFMGVAPAFQHAMGR